MTRPLFTTETPPCPACGGTRYRPRATPVTSMESWSGVIPTYLCCPVCSGTGVAQPLQEVK